MRVVMWPGVGVENENRYIDILVEGLRKAGVDVVEWNKHFSLQVGDIFHVHWPEIVSEIRTLRKTELPRGEWIAFQFFSTIRRIKNCGGAIVYTVHDLYPHDAALKVKPFHQKFMKKYLSKVDLAIALTNGGIEQIRNVIPDLADKPFCVAHHAHYREILGTGQYSQAERKRLGVKPDDYVFSFLGSLRPNKRADLVVEAFRGMAADSNFLVMAGSAKPSIEAEILRVSAGASNITLDLRRISEEEVKKYYSVTDIFVFPGSDYFNSGTIYTALSQSVPVLAAWTPTNADIQRLVGSQWMHLYEGEFSTTVLEDAKRSLIRRGDGVVCDMTPFEPERCTAELIAAYRAALSVNKA